MITPALIVSDPARGNGWGVVRGRRRGFDPVAGKPARWYFGWHFLGLDLRGVRILVFDPGWFYPSEFGCLALHNCFCSETAAVFSFRLLAWSSSLP